MKAQTRRLLQQMERIIRRDITGRVESFFVNHEEIDTIDELMSLDYDDLIKMEGIGEKTALAIEDLQSRIMANDKRYNKRVKPIDIRTADPKTRITTERTSQLTREIESIIKESIAGPCDNVISGLQVRSLSRFLMMSPQYLEQKGFSVIERTESSKVQNLVRDVLIKGAQNTFYSNRMEPLLYSTSAQSGKKIISCTSELNCDEVYVIDLISMESMRIESKLFFDSRTSIVTSEYLNVVAQHYGADVCRRSLAMAIGTKLLSQSI